jgi:hypothetical protein
MPIASDTHIGTITGRLAGQPWRNQPISITELPHLTRMLATAAFVVICYLSGMRPGEVLNLRHGCTGTDPETGELTVRGRLGKRYDRLPAPAGEPEPDRPWVVVAPVHTAVTTLESITTGPLLFPASTIRPGGRRTITAHARTTHDINRDIMQFIGWVNATFTAPAGTQPIPADPTRNVHSRRFRRTLAYFIVRRPRGLIAAAFQYGHVHTRVTLGYSGAADTSWIDDLAVERLEMILDHTREDHTRLHAGEHVSGPAAAEYTTRTGHVARFTGRAVTHARSVNRLLAQTGPGVHHGQGMSCVWRPETAACRQAKLDQHLPPGDGPDETECRTTCPNLAYTDRDIDHQRQRLDQLRIAAADPLAPHPRRDRAAAQAAQTQAIIDRHDQTRPAPGDDHEPPTP